MGCTSCGKGMVAGAFKLAKAELGIGVTNDEVTAARRIVCESCDQWDHGRCRSCGCYTWSKTRLTHERCPLGKWGAAT